MKPRHNSTTMPYQAGFTLVELLVALALFGLMATISYRALDTTLTTNEFAQARMEKLSRLNHAFNLLSRDLLQAVNRPVRDEAGTILPGLYAPGGGSPLLELTHHGRIASIEPILTTLQRTRYRLQDETLRREVWPVLDRAPDSTPSTTTLLEGVQALRLEFIDIDNTTHDQWPYFKSSLGHDVVHLPMGVRLSIEIAPWGEIQRTFLLQSR